MAFFDKIGQTISNGVTTVSDSTKSLAGTAKLNSQITSNKNTIKKTFEDMGRLYYESLRISLPDASLEKLCADIDRLNKETFELELKVKASKGIVICSNCGADVSLSSSFCASCGARVVIPTVGGDEVPAGSKKCIKCGKIESADTKFCSNCGMKMPEEELSKPAIRSCPKCGVSQPGEMKFCSNCGAQMDAEADKPADPVLPADNAEAETEQAEPSVEAEESIQNIQSGIVCPSCQNTEPEGTAFCSNCGTKLGEQAAEGKAETVNTTETVETIETVETDEAANAEKEPAAADNAEAETKQAEPSVEAEESIQNIQSGIVCPSCQNTESEGTVFCSNCGTKLGAQTAESKAETVETIETVETDEAANAEKEPAAADNAEAETEQAEPSVEAEESIQNIQSGIVCPSCQNTEPEGTAFCSNCGTKLGAVPAFGKTETRTVSAADSIVCSKCGRVEPSGMKFCTECGSRLD